MRRRTTLAGLAALAAVLAVLAGARLYPSSTPDTGFASPAGDLACTVKSSCDVGEVEVFRMSGQANAHAQTAATATYGQVVCCETPAPLATDCTEPSGAYDTVLTLSTTDNAHVASDGSYGTEVCLSAPGRVVDCQYGASCDPDYACLATISGTTNAHVADCDGVDDYSTKVCCSVACVPPFTTIVTGDSDCDAAADAPEDGGNPTQCGARGKYDPWDFYDVPVPTIHSGGDMNNRDSAVTLFNDVLAVLEYSGTIDEMGPNGAGRDYDDDIDGDGIDDGVAYDRSVGDPWPELGADKSHSGPPDGAVTLFVDVLLVLDQTGHIC